MVSVNHLRRIAPRFLPLAVILGVRVWVIMCVRESMSVLRRFIAVHVLPHRWFAVRRYVRSSAVLARRNDYRYVGVHPAEHVEHRPPVRRDRDIPVRYRLPETVMVPPAGVLLLPDGHVIGANGDVVDATGSLVWDVSQVFDAPPYAHPRLASSACRRVHRVPGVVATISAAAGGFNIYHFMFDVLPRLHLLQQAGFDPRTLPAIVINGGGGPFVRQILARLGISPAQVLETDKTFHIVADLLLVPSLPRADTRGHWVYRYVRGLPGAGEPDTVSLKRVHISRAGASGRRVRQDGAYHAMLRSHGFVSVHLEEMDFDQQRSVVAGAEVIVAEHGAGLTHIVFCRPDTLVVEILSGAWPIPCYEALASQCGLRYASFFGFPGRERVRFARWGIRADFSVDIRALGQFLTKLGI